MQLASELDISGRVDRTSENPAFITLKDHKPNFENHPKCRLINPSKSSLGKVSKVILDRINNDIRDQVHVNQWRNSTDVISWFINIKDKSRKSFISFDIVDFYPSISESLLDQAIEWAKQHSEISDQDIQVIKHARKSLLHHDGTAWRKRNSDSTFDVTMGSYDGAEVCELIGLFVLDTLKDRFGYDIGLYRDDGLATLNTRSGRLNDKARKDLEHIFNDFGLNITVLTNQLQTNFLDLTLDLTNNTYKPYRKPNDTPLYINRLSNHPPSILKQIPSSIQQRINSLSHNQQAFDTAAPIYNDALKRSNFHAEINYEPGANTNSINKRRTRQRNTIWYNPPFSKNVTTNIARNFLLLLDKHFPPHHRLHSIFNRHTVRVSYSCSDNMKSFLSKHNKYVLKKHNDKAKNTKTNNDTKTCNCRKPDECPVSNTCLAKSLVYKAEVSTDKDNAKVYIGVTANSFKERFRNHTKSIKNERHGNETELSKYIWKLKRAKRSYGIKWSIVKRVPSCKAGSRKCNLCLEEKLLIMKGNKANNLLNKRSELFTLCKHITNSHVT